MNSRKKILSILLGSISLISASAAISCTNKVDNSKQISRQFNKSKAKSQDRENLLLSIEKNKKYISNNELIDEAIRLQLDNINKKYLKNLNFLNIQEFQQIESINNIVKEISHNEETDNKNNSNLDKLKLLKKKKKELEQAWTKQKELKLKQKKLKNIIVGVSIGGAVVAGLSVGLGSYFGLKNINSEINKEVEKLKTRIFLNEDIIRQIKQKDSLFEVLQKILKVAFEKDLPNAIFNLVDKLLLKTVLKEYVTESSSNQLNEILKNEFKTKTTEIVNEILAGLSSINSNHNIDEIIKKTQEKISQVVTKFVPDFVKGTINYLAKLDETAGSTHKKSILALLIKRLLKTYHIIVSDELNLSKLLNFYSIKITSNDNELISFVIKEFSDVIKNNNISFNIINDVYEIINKTLAKLLTKDNETIDINLIFETLVPKLLDILIKAVDTTNQSGLLEFINNIFEQKNNQIKFIYDFIDSEININSQTVDVYLNSINSMKIEKNSSIFDINRIKIPKLQFNFTTIINSLFKLSDIKNILTKFLEVIIKPISALLKNDKNKEAAKKALFRIAAIYTFLYYKYVPFSGGFLGGIINIFNPFEPTSFLKIILEKELKDSNVKLKEILGKETTISGLFSSSTNFDIFILAKESASVIKNNNKINEFKKALKEGMLKN
ncbi:hypothetical protein [Mycoplasma phocimorsus]|uniref:hypothetical protein n=1 Tax=Mycoplasma phocimorsus TaxID=3045839 RepID=UPI0024BF6DB6|nr:hypothetical protein [Mycoplasma phocimorsus]MDJ1646583.1 hypothetical protein [Mycoplasma phocimorsus]